MTTGPAPVDHDAEYVITVSESQWYTRAVINNYT